MATLMWPEYTHGMGLRCVGRAGAFSLMSTNKRSVHMATITRTVKGKTYTSVLMRRICREGGSVEHPTFGISPICRMI